MQRNVNQLSAIYRKKNGEKRKSTMNTRKSNVPIIQTLLLAFPVMIVLLLAFIPPFSISKGAQPYGGFLYHIRYGIVYELHNPFTLLPTELLCVGIGLLCEGLVNNKKFSFRILEFLLAIFFSENILIGLTENRRIIALVALPGLSFLENTLLWIGLLIAVSAVIRIIVLVLMEPGRKEAVKKACFRRTGWLWAAITLVCWIPIILLRAPGGIMWDTRTQIRSFQGLETMDASHPLLTTLIYGSLYTLGQALWCDDFGIILCVLAQGALTLYAVAVLGEEVKNCCHDPKLGLVVSLFYGLVSVFPMFVMMALRDSLFGPLYLLFAIYYRRMLSSNEKRDIIWLIILGALCAATRKAAIYLVVLSFFGLLLYRKSIRRLLSAAIMGLIAVHWAIILFLCPALNILPPADYENYSLFYYITGYYCQNHAQELSDEDIGIISDVLDYNAVLTKFNPDQNNDVKYTFHAESSEQVRRYIVLNLKFLFRHPLTVLEAVFYSRCDYFLPLYSGSENIMGEMDSAWLDGPTLDRLNAIQWNLNVKSPLRALNFSGLYNWLCLIIAVAAVESKRSEKFMMCLPALLMTLGLLTTHTNGAVRYALPIIYCVPMMLLLFRATGREKHEYHTEIR